MRRLAVSGKDFSRATVEAARESPTSSPRRLPNRTKSPAGATPRRPRGRKCFLASYTPYEDGLPGRRAQRGSRVAVASWPPVRLRDDGTFGTIQARVTGIRTKEYQTYHRPRLAASSPTRRRSAFGKARALPRTRRSLRPSRRLPRRVVLRGVPTTPFLCFPRRRGLVGRVRDVSGLGVCGLADHPPSAALQNDLAWRALRVCARMKSLQSAGIGVRPE
jgi:hypothetical protein